MTKTIDERIEAHERRRLDIGREIFNLLLEMGKAPAAGYSGHDFRLEAYDISNTNGVDTVGAMVVFKGLLPQKNDYRKFKVRTVEELVKETRTLTGLPGRAMSGTRRPARSRTRG